MALDYTIMADGGLLKVTTTGFDSSLDEAVSYAESVISPCVGNQCTVQENTC